MNAMDLGVIILSGMGAVLCYGTLMILEELKSIRSVLESIDKK